jgi:hypothetical protein
MASVSWRLLRVKAPFRKRKMDAMHVNGIATFWPEYRIQISI